MRPVSSSSVPARRLSRLSRLPALRLSSALTLGLLLSACAEIPAQGNTGAGPGPVVPTPAPLATLSPSALVFSGNQKLKPGDPDLTSAPQTAHLKNNGASPLTVTSLAFSGPDAASFSADGLPSTARTLAPGEQLNVTLRFNPAPKAGVLRVDLTAQLQGALQLSLHLTGLSASGVEGEYEPPLAQVVQALGYSTDVGGTQLLLGTSAPLLGQEVRAPLFRKSGAGPVTLTPVARYSPAGPLTFGLFTLQGGAPLPHQVGVVAEQQYQTLNPQLDALASGNVSFDPGSEPFGVYTGASAYSATRDYTQDSLNTGPARHAMRVYPAISAGDKAQAGQAQPGYLVTVEASSNGDYQDAVFLLQGAEPVTP